MDKLLEDWKSCFGCEYSKLVDTNIIVHRDRWDSMKRSLGVSVYPEIDKAEHRGNWVVIPDKTRICRYDENWCLPDDVFHHCPWHGHELVEEEPWWQ